MWCVKIWLAVIVVFVCSTCINTSKKVDMKRHGKFRVFKNRKFCKNGGTLVCPRIWRRSCRCICPDGWSGRRCACSDESPVEKIVENKDFISVMISDQQTQSTPSYIFMTTDTSTKVNIITSETLPEDHITSFISSITIPYPDFTTNGTPNVKAIRIRSTEKSSVTVSVQDITNLITTQKLSTLYILTAPLINTGYQAYVATTVTAIHDDTSITISDWGEETTFPSYTLNALETHVEKYDGTDPKSYRIQSSKPVAVFTGLYCISDIPCSNLVEQIPPFNQLDTIYIIPPFHKTILTFFTFTSKEDTTVTYSDQTRSITGGLGVAHRLLSDETVVLRSADPILVTANAVNRNLNNPYWTVVPGVNQYLPRYKILIQNGWTNNYINVMIRKSAIDGLRANEQPLDTNTIRFETSVFVDDLEYSVITAEVTEGELTLESIDDIPFGLVVYGSRENGGYGFAGNTILR